ncbi:MAG: error-prone DNA polymerase [Rhodospirillaceae bacterium]|nr:error-prone DNA polymerase [Rhodospirillaceae bacterium]MBT5780113.1 error-prone DNA polymerase [Rhodospirillaceae bacterium]
MSAYAELQVASNYSFLRGASHPQELIERAAELGHCAIALTDRNSLAGVVRAHVAARESTTRLIPGARLDLTAELDAPDEHSGPSFLCLPTDRAAYGRLSSLLTLGKRRAPKGQCWITLDDVLGHARGQILIALPPDEVAHEAAFATMLETFSNDVSAPCYLAAHHLYRGDDARRLVRLEAIAEHCGTPLVASNDVHAHDASRRALQDVLTCIREHCTIDTAGWRLQANAERHLKSAAEMARLFVRHADAVAQSVEIADACRFNLDELRYEYPAAPVSAGRTVQEELAHLSWQGAAARWPDGVPAKVRAQIEHELELIGALGYAPYFLTVYDIVCFARARGILCQGRGSAANSAVCYCLTITAVDPNRMDLLFERFVSAARDEPPDIDVDFEHERREEVIQYIYEKYGRERAGIAATVISYRSRSAVREVGKALGLTGDVVGALSSALRHWGRDGGNMAARVREVGLDPADRRLALALHLTRELIGFPRHLSQHVGGFVITRGPLSEMVPVMNAAMDERTNIEWDKDDLDALGILKIDVLGLGMLSCIRKGFELLAREHDLALGLAEVPAEDPAVYDMLCQADSVGVFQVESRAQMTMLPRLKPRIFYDLVIEVAIVRPGPIQGDMVHPYLRRRNGKEEVIFPSAELEQVLGKTLGVPLFQEQAMKIAIVAAGFSPEEADKLRRAMATFRRSGLVHTFHDKMINGMVERGYEEDFAERCFRQIEGFGDYGFPESHAASFALLVYVSAWLKCHYPAVFAAAILNSQPMGFYAPAQLVRDARAHGVEVLDVDVNASAWDCTLEASVQSHKGRALRLGFRKIKGFPEVAAAQIVAARAGGYHSIADLRHRADLSKAVLERLARADALRSMGLTRRAAAWDIRALGDGALPLFAALGDGGEEGIHAKTQEPGVFLPAMRLGEQVVEDYATLRMSLRCHPVQLLRPELAARGIVPAKELARLKPERRFSVAGLVLARQRPGTAKGVIFMTLEDETGVANLIVWANVFERFRRAVMASRLLICRGRLQREGLVIHIIAEQLEDFSHRLDGLVDLGRAAEPPAPATRLAIPSRDFH